MGAGRFAPSPTGPLHLGSLASALASWLDARSRGDAWWLRHEDLDPPREQAGAKGLIEAQLLDHGLAWDAYPCPGGVMTQSLRGSAYALALGQLTAAGLSYPCRCSRKALALRACPCRDAAFNTPAIATSASQRAWSPEPQTAWRFRDPSGQDDFVLFRADGLWAYHLAVVVDDAEQGVSRVVRGDDLASALPAHRALQAALGLAQPEVLHVPVVCNAQGEKLSKQTKASPLRADRVDDQLRSAWAHLRTTMPQDWLAQVGPTAQARLGLPG